MAGVAVDEGALGGVQNGAEKSNESVGGDGCAEHAVDDAADARRTVQVANGCAQTSLHIGHEQSGGNAFAGNVGDADGQAVSTESQDIEVISAYGAGRLPGGRYFEP